jgi:hypothetical protein
LYILVSAFAKIAAVSFNAFGCIPSDPGDLFGFISISNLRTSFSSIWCPAHISGNMQTQKEDKIRDIRIKNKYRKWGKHNRK